MPHQSKICLSWFCSIFNFVICLYHNVAHFEKYRKVSMVSLNFFSVAFYSALQEACRVLVWVLYFQLLTMGVYLQLGVLKCTPSHLSQAIRTRPPLPKPRISPLSSAPGLCHVGFVPFSKVSYPLVTGLSLHMLFPLFKGFFLISPSNAHLSPGQHLRLLQMSTQVQLSRETSLHPVPLLAALLGLCTFTLLSPFGFAHSLRVTGGRVSASLNKLRSLRAVAVQLLLQF